MLLNLMEVKFIASVSHDYDEKRELASGFASANPLYFTNLPFLLSSFFKNSKSKMINKIYSKKIICKCLANFEYLKTGLNRFASRTLLNDTSICSAIISHDNRTNNLLRPSSSANLLIPTLKI